MRNQILHIFRKDVHHQWPEIAVSLAAVATYAWQQALANLAWSQPPFGETLMELLRLLVPVAWIFLIVRVVQDENLVGDRQFWVTRPYVWGNLFVAKLLFVLVFINVPLFFVQAFLLKASGYALVPHMIGLLWLQLLWMLYVITPMLVLATITRGIGQFVLTLLAALVAFVISAPLIEKVNPQEAFLANNLPNTLALIIILVTAVGVVLWQFSRRRVNLSRATIIGAAVLVEVVLLLTPYRILIARKYPMAKPGQPLPVQLAFDPAPLTNHEGPFAEKDKVHVLIPLLASGMELGSIADADGMLENIQTNDGAKWNSGWGYSGGLSFYPDHQHAYLNITLDKAFFERVKSTPANIRLTLAMAAEHARKTVTTVARGGGFLVPGEGRCGFADFNSDGIQCSFPLTAPFLLARVKSEEITCPVRKNETALPAGMVLYESFGSSGPGPADFALNPVQWTAFYQWDPGWSWNDSNAREYRPRVCPGTPITLFYNWEDLPRYQTQLEIDGIRLADYQLKDSRSDGTGFGVIIP